MLRRLTVENYALIERLDLELDAHLNIITGETGAGKSILLGALGLLLGNKNESGTIRDQERNCIIEGQFDVDGYGLEAFFEENDLDYEPQTVIRRMISPSGKSRSFINDMPVQLSVLRDLGAQEVVVVSRTGENNYQNLSRHADAGLIVNTTPVGMYPNVGISPVCLGQFPALEGVLDIVYNPARTQLLIDAERFLAE